MCAVGDDDDNVNDNHNTDADGTGDHALYEGLVVMILMTLTMPTLVSSNCHMTKPNVTWERSIDYRISIIGWPVGMTVYCIC